MSKSEAGSAAKRRRRSQQEIQERLLTAAAAEFSARGYSEATTAAIARKADTTEAQLFRYFTSKSELFSQAIFEPLNEHLLQFQSKLTAEESTPANVERQADAYIAELRKFIEEHARKLMSLLVTQMYLPKDVLPAGQIAGLRAYFEHGAAAMRQRLGDDAPASPELAVRVSFATVLACVLFKDLLFPPDIAEGEAVNAAVRDFVIEGLAMHVRPAREAPGPQET